MCWECDGTLSSLRRLESRLHMYPGIVNRASCIFAPPLSRLMSLVLYDQSLFPSSSAKTQLPTSHTNKHDPSTSSPFRRIQSTYDETAHFPTPYSYSHSTLDTRVRRQKAEGRNKG
ncbi:hypothetical protein PTI98_008707 [Pleurotus ostreatus]|nr:hypothetical protein PTI98_008707 [Pleurotus ostreatus]